MPVPPRTSVLTLMRLENKHVAEVRRILSASNAAITREIRKLPEGTLKATQLRAQQASIKAYLDQDWKKIESVISSGKVAAGSAASKVVSMYESELFSSVMDPSAVARIAQSEALRAANGVEAAVRRMEGTSYLPLSKRVYNTQKLAQGWVDETINQALVSGWDAKRLAKEITASINPDTPGGVSYAANRLARTEINNAFHASSVARYNSSGIVDQVDWHLSTSHPEGDICDSLVADSPYKINSVPLKPHPHCYCYITPALPEPDEFLDNLLNGDYGDEPWSSAVSAEKIDTAYQKSASVLNKMTTTQLRAEQAAHTKRYDSYVDNWIARNGALKVDADYQRLWADPVFDSINAYRIQLRDLAVAKQLAAKAAPKAASVARKAATAKRPANPKVAATQTTNVNGNLALQAKFDKGYTVERVLSEDSANGVVSKIRFSDGSYGVLKRSSVSDTQNEILASEVFRKTGAKVPTTVKVTNTDGDWVLSEFVNGKNAWDGLDIDEYVAKAAADPKSGLAAMVRGDYLIANADRHAGNWMVGASDEIIGIDHGIAFHAASRRMDITDVTIPYLNQSADLFAGFDAAATKKALESTRPLFQEMDRLDAYDGMMARFDLLAQAAKDGSTLGIQ